jgi:hypothetical protein
LINKKLKAYSGLLLVILILLNIITVNNQYFTGITSVSSAPAWWNVSWDYRKAITIESSQVPARLYNFPVMIDISDSDLAAKAQSDGDDIVFTTEDGSKLYHEIESYSSGNLVAWVRIPSLSASSDTVIYMYYGNPSAGNQQAVPNVWASRYKMVQHLSESSGTLYDSTWGNNDGSTVGSVSRISGVIDGAVAFAGTSDYIQIPSSASISGFTSAMTISAWVRLDVLNRDQSILHLNIAIQITLWLSMLHQMGVSMIGGMPPIIHLQDPGTMWL